MTPLVMVDLFAGLGGASAAMRARGWHVTSVDSRAELQPDVVADVRQFRWDGGPVDLLWASPPCDQYARRDKRCWFPDEPEPSAELVAAALRLVMEIRPRFWLLENVRGAIRYLAPVLGEPVVRHPPLFLWGNPPPGLALLLPKAAPCKDHCSRRSSDPRALALNSDDRRKQLRALVPFAVSEAVAVCTESARAGRPLGQLQMLLAGED